MLLNRLAIESPRYQLTIYIGVELDAKTNSDQRRRSFPVYRYQAGHYSTSYRYCFDLLFEALRSFAEPLVTSWNSCFQTAILRKWHQERDNVIGGRGKINATGYKFVSTSNCQFWTIHIFVQVLQFLLMKFNYVNMYHRYLIYRYLFYIILLFIYFIIYNFIIIREYIHKVEFFIVIHIYVHSRARTHTHILGSCIYDKSFYYFNFAYNYFWKWTTQFYKSRTKIISLVIILCSVHISFICLIFFKNIGIFYASCKLYNILNNTPDIS